MDALSNSNLILVGPTYLTKLNKFLSFNLLEVPSLNCYLDKRRIINEILQINETTQNNVYLFSASMATNAIIDFFKSDNTNTYLDFGSFWDKFFIKNSDKANIASRSCDILTNEFNQLYKDYLIH